MYYDLCTSYDDSVIVFTLCGQYTVLCNTCVYIHCTFFFSQKTGFLYSRTLIK